jgi:RND family efflux transporter MFP subunit
MSHVVKCIGVVGVVLLGLALIGCGEKPQVSAAPQGRPPSNVGVSTAVQQDIPVYGDWVATLDGFVNANIQPQVSGYLIKQNYREGSFVHKGDLLFEIDPRPFRAALDQAKGQLAEARGQLRQNQGQLAEARAQLGLAEINVKRNTPLAAAHAIPQSQLDNDIQTKAQAEAQVSRSEGAIEASKAAIQAAEAAVKQAELNFEFTQVRSLIDGIAGLATVQIGNLVSQTAVLTTVSAVNPIKAYFSISEQEYLDLTGRIQRGSDLLRLGGDVPLQLTLSNTKVYPHQGRMIFADRQIDPQTGTIRIVGQFPNPGNVLRPGQFGRIRAQTAFRKGAVLIPQKAVSELQGRHQVAVVSSDNKVSIRTVETGERVNEMWIINSGLSAGEHVVTEGTSKVVDGAPVNPGPDTTRGRQ